MIPSELTVNEMLAKNGNFTQLSSAIDQAGLSDLLGGTWQFRCFATQINHKANAIQQVKICSFAAEGNFTVFAPTDDAFAQLPEDTLNAIFGDKAQLKGGWVLRPRKSFRGKQLANCLVMRKCSVPCLLFQSLCITMWWTAHFTVMAFTKICLWQQFKGLFLNLLWKKMVTIMFFLLILLLFWLYICALLSFFRIEETEYKCFSRETKGRGKRNKGGIKK